MTYVPLIKASGGVPQALACGGWVKLIQASAADK